MKTLLISQSDISGGAARAAFRLHRAFLQYGIESRMKVRQKFSDDWTVETHSSTIFYKAANLLRPTFGNMISRFQNQSKMETHSGNWLPSNWSAFINKSNADVVHLHWIGAETLSIEDIARITKPLVWTFHDMWPFCGTEHYAPDNLNARWRIGYDKAEMLQTNRGFDLSKIVWNRKRKAWRNPFQIVAPSRWMSECAQNSILFNQFSFTNISNTLDTSVYRPLDRNFCRNTLRIPENLKIILFGAVGGGQDPRKGYDLLLQSLKHFCSLPNSQRPMLIIFGQSEPQFRPSMPLDISIKWMGKLHDDQALVLLYNAADVMIVPSRQDNLPQTAIEAQACGCPIVAFNTCGFPDAVVHLKTGYLAKAFDTHELAEGIRWILENDNVRDELSRAARQRAVKLWSPDVVVPQYLAVYRKAIEEKSKRSSC